MTKKEVQRRVSRVESPIGPIPIYVGPIDLDDFMWDEHTGTFSSAEHNLVLDFEGLHECRFMIASDCKLVAGDFSLIDALDDCVLETGDCCTFDLGDDCELKTGEDCVVIRRGHEGVKMITLPKGKRVRIDDSTDPGYEIIDGRHMITIHIKL